MSSLNSTAPIPAPSKAQGPWSALELHTLGWKAFQDLCSQVVEEVLQRTASIYREAQDGGQDAVFLISAKNDIFSNDGTVQCKFTSTPSRRLRASAIRTEEQSIAELVRQGQAETYILMTNMGVDAPTAVAIRKRLRELGVAKPHVLGGEFLTRAIRNSARLRALVPRVYGLGDLSIILDERRATQTRALLGHLADTLRVYVPTEPHRRAVRALADHKTVLLLGEPATGKSTIAAILATTSLEGEGHRAFKCEGPIDLLSRWNPHENGCFYWVDDAFGATQVRNDYVDTWISVMQSAQAAAARGNRFVLTSRRHIYEAAKLKLGTRNHPLFKTGASIVDVGALSLDERRQILYNHLKAGQQPRSWISSIKSHLEQLASESSFIPEIARRLGDPLYTVRLGTSRAALLAFVREPRTHLIEVINELARIHHAALALVYVARSKLLIENQDEVTWNLVSTSYGVDKVSIADALQELDKSFIVIAKDGENSWWTFKHPTIVDAMSEIIAKNGKLADLYIRGAHWRDLLSELVCAGRPLIKDAIVISGAQIEVLADRLAGIPNEPDANRILFRFLEDRASDECLRLCLLREPDLFRRSYWDLYDLSYDPKLATMARALHMGILPDELRSEATEKIRTRIFNNMDMSVLNDDSVLSLIKPTDLIILGIDLRRALSEMPDQVADIERDVPDDQGGPDAFADYQKALDRLNDLFVDDEGASEALSLARGEMEKALGRLAQRDPPEDREWEAEDVEPDVPSIDASERSTFSDVDE